MYISSRLKSHPRKPICMDQFYLFILFYLFLLLFYQLLIELLELPKGILFQPCASLESVGKNVVI